MSGVKTDTYYGPTAVAIHTTTMRTGGHCVQLYPKISSEGLARAHANLH